MEVFGRPFSWASAVLEEEWQGVVPSASWHEPQNTDQLQDGNCSGHRDWSQIIGLALFGWGYVQGSLAAEKSVGLSVG